MTNKEQNNSDNLLSGIILKGVGGIYTCLITWDKKVSSNEALSVENKEQTIECTPRGLFRKQKITPMVGDRVKIARLDDGTGRIEEILERKNNLTRPPVANIDKLLIVISVIKPSPNFLVIDKMTAMAEHEGIEPVIVINKADLDDKVNDEKDSKWLKELYSLAGYKTFIVSAQNCAGINGLKQSLIGFTVAFAGNSGVGKSSVLNCIDSRFELEVGDISQKLGRGKHTTRVAQLFLQEQDGFFVDTPGFSSIDISQVKTFDVYNLSNSFKDLSKHAINCKFSDCMHLKEIGCAVTKAVNKGQISNTRYESYVAMHSELEGARQW